MLKKLGYATIALVFIFMIIQLVVYYPKLPSTLASHFNLKGDPDGWLSKSLFFCLYFVIQLSMVAAFVLFSRLSRKLPNTSFNIPNKEFWLRTDTKKAFFNLNDMTLIWIAATTLIFIAFVMQIVIQSNVSQTSLNTGAMLLSLVTYLFCLFGLMRLFYKTLKNC